MEKVFPLRGKGTEWDLSGLQGTAEELEGNQARCEEKDSCSLRYPSQRTSRKVSSNPQAYNKEGKKKQNPKVSATSAERATLSESLGRSGMQSHRDVLQT